MDIPKTLSGEELVTRGVTKSFATLPEIGLKDVTPNGSWLEQKQIQAALEARKHLIEVERIEKFGTLSQAEWKDDQKLAEVTKQTGSHWQFFGHNVGKKLYLRREEALFLIEVNCLQLKHNDVTVSLQKAYALLLDDTFTINQYRVYASLSRLGYKVYRHREINRVSEKHQDSKPTTAGSSNSDSNTDIENAVGSQNKNDLPNTTEKVDESSASMQEAVLPSNRNDTESTTNVESATDTETNKTCNTMNDKDMTYRDAEEKPSKADETELQQKNIDDETEVSPTIEITTEPENGLSNSKQNGEVDDNPLQNNNSDENNTDSTVQCCLENVEAAQNSPSLKTEKNENNNKIFHYKIKLQKLQSRTLKVVPDINRFFEQVPEMANKDIIFINTPDDFCMPKNIFVNKNTYKLNLDSVKAKHRRPSSSESSYSSSGEEDQSRRKIQNTPRSGTPQNTNRSICYPQTRPSRVNQQFRSFLFWRPRPHFNLNHFNVFHPRPYLQNQCHPRFHFNTRPNPFLRTPLNMNMLESRNHIDNSFNRAPKRSKFAKQSHLQAINILASKVKHHILSGNMLMSGNTHIQTLQALQRLLYAYNVKFNASLRFTPQLEVVEDTNVVETIELDADDEIQCKKPRLEEDTFNENLKKLRHIALKLRNLEIKGISTSRHRRALSNAVKTFNKSYNADVYLNDNYEMIDRRHITLDSSSDAESAVKEPIKRQKKKRLRNPFYILKKRSETQSNGNASTSKDNSEICEEPEQTTSCVTDNLNLKKINPQWLPKDDAFNKVAFCSKNGVYTCEKNCYEDQFIYDYLKSHAEDFGDWLEIKVAFTKYLTQLNQQYETAYKKVHLTSENQTGFHSIIEPGDCSDMPAMLEKLRIIKCDNTVNAETNIKIDFDVYNRDVQNFRKTNRPKPHFRIVCYNGSSKLPTGGEIATLHAKYEDGIAIVFAVVDVGSISYLQINPVALPVYLQANSE